MYESHDSIANLPFKICTVVPFYMYSKRMLLDMMMNWLEYQKVRNFTQGSIFVSLQPEAI